MYMQVGSYYWWNGAEQLWPNKDYQENALKYAQSAYFVSIVVVQWADLIIAKTRKLSVFEQVGTTSKFSYLDTFVETYSIDHLCMMWMDSDMYWGFLLCTGNAQQLHELWALLRNCSGTRFVLHTIPEHNLWNSSN